MALANPLQAPPNPQPDPYLRLLTSPTPKSKPNSYGFNLFTGTINYNHIHTMAPAILLYREGQLLPERGAMFDQFFLHPYGNIGLKVVAPDDMPERKVEIGWVPFNQRHDFVELCLSTRSNIALPSTTQRFQAWVDDVLAQARARGYIVVRP
ncbi:hypothetical protein K505DRAFT_336487 [Melanomma pulvis-pyrius CBS 109.77]|uniref:Uncharacterized protein n=1 Tax=Melanomma pulvis-pyrius CBS 109.77 TaxID=1314802 RepID=A0A6A6XEC2_9PLEO|nr:hypothetical protein K505DRAFT_336487 [Melanomma pulvis-pyrius CBS 109.77]